MDQYFPLVTKMSTARATGEIPQSNRQFGKAIAEFQLIQAMLADSKAESYAARTMVFDAARKKEAGENITLEAACAKMFATEAAANICEKTARIFASYGYAMEYPVQRFLRDVRFMLIGGGTSDILKLIIAKELST